MVTDRSYVRNVSKYHTRIYARRGQNIFHHKLLAAIICVALYTSAVVFTLFLLEFWNATILKDTIFWFCIF